MSSKRVATAALLAPLLAALVSAAGATSAVAQPSPSGAPGDGIHVPEAVPGEEVCTIADQRLRELSGLAALENGYATMNDGDQQQWDAQPIFFLDDSCQVVDQEPYSGGGSYDPEAMAYDRDNDVLWVGDIGDNFETTGSEARETVAFWRLDLSGDRTPVIYRVAYPDGPRDAETLILDGDGTPLIVTKPLGGAAGIYRPAGELVADNPHEQAVPLERVGEFAPPETDTEHPLGAVARSMITGGAVSPDGSRVVLRTYADAFEFDVTGGDIVTAITEGTPRVTPLPGEPQGESIAYTWDGAHFLTVSEVADQPELQPVFLRYQPSQPPPPEPTGEPGGGSGTADSGPSLLDRLGWRGILYLVGGLGLVGVLMVAAGVFGIVRARRQQPDGPDDDEDFDAVDGGEDRPVAARAQVGPPPGDVPGGAAGPPHPGGQEPHGQGGVYTSGYAAGAEYGEPEPPPPDPRQARRGTGGEPRGTVYGAGAGYQEHPFDQDNPHRHHREPPAPPPPEPSGGTYRAGTYQSGHRYEAGQYEAGQYEAGQYEAGQYEGDRYRAGRHDGDSYEPHGRYDRQRYRHDDVPDYYYDDPDYSYEFRDRGR